MVFFIVALIYGLIVGTCHLAGWDLEIGAWVSTFVALCAAWFLWPETGFELGAKEWGILRDGVTGNIRAKRGAEDGVGSAMPFKGIFEKVAVVKTDLDPLTLNETYTVATGTLRMKFTGSWAVRDTEKAVIAFWKLDPKDAKKRASEAQAWLVRTMQGRVSTKLLSCSSPDEMLRKRNEILAGVVRDINNDPDSFICIGDFKVTDADKDPKQQAYERNRKLRDDFIKSFDSEVAKHKANNGGAEPTDAQRNQIGARCLIASGLLDSGDEGLSGNLLLLQGLGLSNTLLTKPQNSNGGGNGGGGKPRKKRKGTSGP